MMLFNITLLKYYKEDVDLLYKKDAWFIFIIINFEDYI